MFGNAKYVIRLSAFNMNAISINEAHRSWDSYFYIIKYPEMSNALY